MTEGLRTATATRFPTPPPQTCSAAARRVISVDDIPLQSEDLETAPPMHYGVGGNGNGNNNHGNDNIRTQRELDLEDRLARVEGALAAVLHELHAQRCAAANDARARISQREEARLPQRGENRSHQPQPRGDVKVTNPMTTVAVPDECATSMPPPRPDSSSSTSDLAARCESRPQEASIDRSGAVTPTPRSSNVSSAPSAPLTTSVSGDQQQRQQHPQRPQQVGEERPHQQQQAEGRTAWIPKRPQHGSEGPQHSQGEGGAWIPVPEKGGRRRRRRRNNGKNGGANDGEEERRTHRRSDTGDSRTSTSSGGSSCAFSSSSSSSGGSPRSPKSVTLSSSSSPPRTPLLVHRIEDNGSGVSGGGGCSSSAVSPLSPWPSGGPSPPSAATSSGGRRRGRSRTRPERFGDEGEQVPPSSPRAPPPPGSPESPPGSPPPAVEYRNFSDAHVEELRRRSNSVTNNNNDSASEVACGGGEEKNKDGQCSQRKKDDDHHLAGDEGRCSGGAGPSRSPQRRPRRQHDDRHQPQDQLLLHPPPGSSQLRQRRVTAIDDPSAHDSSSSTAQPQPRTALQVMSESNKSSPSTCGGAGIVTGADAATVPPKQVISRPPGLPPRPAPPSSSASPPRKSPAAAVVVKSKQVNVTAPTASAAIITGNTPNPGKTKVTNAAPSSASSATVAQSSPTIKPIPSFVDYVRVEMLGNGAEGSPEKDCDRNMEEFLRVPSRLESLLVLGLLVCTDSFLNVLTVLPLKFARSLADLTWTVMRGRRNTRLVFHRRHLYQLLQGFIIAFVSYFLLQISVGMLYHWIRGQTMLKLYLIMAIVEVFDRLMCSFGQDALDSLYWNTTRRPHHPRMIISVVVVLVYAVLHSLVLFVHIATLNVAMNSADQALLSLLIGGNFAEIKSTVFKKYNKQNLFNITTADICERFKLVLFLFLILLLNFFQGGNSVAIVRAFLTMSVLVLTSEVLSDWIKHSFITKFNHIRSSVYRDYSLIIAGDVTGIGHEGVDLDHTHAVVKRVGLAQIPLVCVAARYLREAVRYSYLTYGDGDVTRMVRGTVLIFVLLLVVKVVLGMVLTATAARILERERRRGKGEGGDSPPVGPVDPSKKPKRPVV